MMERVSNIRATREIFYREITILLNMANNLYAMVIMVPLEIEKSV